MAFDERGRMKRMALEHERLVWEGRPPTPLSREPAEEDDAAD